MKPVLSHDEIASRLRSYWASLGYRVDVVIESGKPCNLPDGSVRTVRVVRSNLWNGLPPGCPSSDVPFRR